MRRFFFLLLGLCLVGALAGCPDDDDDSGDFTPDETPDDSDELEGPLPSGNTTTGSDGTSTAVSEGSTDLVGYRFLLFGDIANPTAELPGATVVADAAERGGGAGVGFGMTLAEAPPVGAPEQLFQYGWVFDTDGDPANDWTGIAAFPDDFFIGADRWYELHLGPGQPADLRVSNIGTDQSINAAASGAVALLDGETLWLVVPLSEFAQEPTMRLTAFRHDGSFLQGPWNADVHPTVPEMWDLPDGFWP